SRDFLMPRCPERFDSSDMGFLDQFRSIKKGLKLQPAEMDVRKLFPMFAPASFFESGKWPGPYILPAAEGVGFTWALDLPAGGMRLSGPKHARTLGSGRRRLESRGTRESGRGLQAPVHAR